MDSITDKELREVEGLCKRATAGPWEWYGNTKTAQVHLATVYGGRKFVIGFNRWGMRGAQPTFQVDHLMVEGKDLAQYEVAPVVGVKKARETGSGVYREDFIGFDHPDADFIARSRDLVPRLVRDLRKLRTLIEKWREIGVVVTEDWDQMIQLVNQWRGE